MQIILTIIGILLWIVSVCLLIKDNIKLQMYIQEAEYSHQRILQSIYDKFCELVIKYQIDRENRDYKEIAYKMGELIEEKYMQEFVINWETKDVKLVDKK